MLPPNFQMVKKRGKRLKNNNDLPSRERKKVAPRSSPHDTFHEVKGNRQRGTTLNRERARVKDPVF